MLIYSDNILLKNVSKERIAVGRIREALKIWPVVILYGPRKVGKTTALMQLAVDNPNVQYIDCGNPKDVADMKYIFDNVDDVTLLVDEVQKLSPINWTVKALASWAQRTKNFKVVFTGSVTGFMSQLARENGGGRNKKIRMPIITYLEYLYFTGIIPSYDVDLKTVDYGNSFQDYMKLKGLEYMNIGPINQEYIDETVREMEEATRNVDLTTSLLRDRHDDILRAYMLIAYKLIENWGYQTVFYQPQIGHREFKARISETLIGMGLVDDFSVYQAASADMTDVQISEAVRHLLWSELALYHEIINKDEPAPESNLVDLYLGKEKDFARFHLKDLFGKASIDVVNPLIYSAIAEEFWDIMVGWVSKNTKPSSNANLLAFIKQKLSSRSDFLKDKNVMGCWVECYIRGAFALLNSVGTPMVARTFHDSHNKEVDIVGDVFCEVLIECAVKDNDKSEKDVHFDLAYTGREFCILTTKGRCAATEMNGIKVLKIPYWMLAAFLDRGEIPKIEDFE
jgi:predicted AAA+ superfamily ATPase